MYKLAGMMSVLLCWMWPALAFGQTADTPQSINSQWISLNQPSVALTSFDMAYFIDASQKMSLADIQQQTFTGSTNDVTLGTNAQTTWSRIQLLNNTDKTLQLYLHHPHAYHLKNISFYHTSQGQIVAQAYVDLEDTAANPMLFGGSAVFPFSLAPGVSSTLYIKNVTLSHQWYSLDIYDAEHSKRALVGSGNYIAVLVGMMLALMIYNFFLYLSARKIENVVYALYLISGTLWVGLSYGVAANFFGIYSASIMQLNSTLLSMPSFLVIFVMLIFETRRRYPKEHLALSVILFMLVADFIYSLFDVVGALKPASTLAATMMLVTFGVSLSLWRKRDPLAKYFLLGHSMFIIFNMLAVFYYKGLSPANQINSHGVGIGILLEALMMAFILSYRIKALDQLKARQVELKRQADTDPMTNLYNRRYLESRAQQLLSDARLTGAEQSVLIADLDHFKAINDTYGHHIGDLVITEFANIMRQNQRAEDVSCRYGGEEFVMLLNCNLTQALNIAERIRGAAERAQVIAPGGERLRFTVSIGVHPIDTNNTSLEQALDQADKALYHAKRSGRNRVLSSAQSGPVRQDNLQPADTPPNDTQPNSARHDDAVQQKHR